MFNSRLLQTISHIVLCNGCPLQPFFHRIIDCLLPLRPLLELAHEGSKGALFIVPVYLREWMEALAPAANALYFVPTRQLLCVSVPEIVSSMQALVHPSVKVHFPAQLEGRKLRELVWHALSVNVPEPAPSAMQSIEVGWCYA